jgi:hypothetical protein
MNRLGLSQGPSFIASAQTAQKTASDSSSVAYVIVAAVM